MGSAFDIMQRTVFATAQNQFGFDASWTPANGGTTYTCKVLFRNPTEVMKLAGAQFMFDPHKYEMEYQTGDFPGLKEAADTRTTNERVTVDGSDFYVMEVAALYDGKTFRATLNPALDL